MGEGNEEKSEATEELGRTFWKAHDALFRLSRDVATAYLNNAETMTPEHQDAAMKMYAEASTASANLLAWGRRAADLGLIPMVVDVSGERR